MISCLLYEMEPSTLYGKSVLFFIKSESRVIRVSLLLKMYGAGKFICIKGTLIERRLEVGQPSVPKFLGRWKTIGS